MANLQLLAPLISLTQDIKNFCAPLLRTKPLLIVALVYTVVSYVVILVQQIPSINVLSLYRFAQSFRFQFAGVATAGFLVYVLLVSGTRQILDRYEHRRLKPI